MADYLDLGEDNTLFGKIWEDTILGKLILHSLVVFRHKNLGKKKFSTHSTDVYWELTKCEAVL